MEALKMVGLKQEQWDIVISILDGSYEKTESMLKAPDVNINMTREQINDLKEHASDISEILTDITDQVAE